MRIVCGVAVFGILLFVLGVGILASHTVDPTKVDISSNIEFFPPILDVVVWYPPNSTNNSTLTFWINISEVGDREYSRIMDFGIIIVAKGGAEKILRVNPVGADPITSEDYEIPMNLTKLIGVPVAIINGAAGESWGGINRNYIVFGENVSGSGWLIRSDEHHAHVNGTIRFLSWREGKYFLVIWAIDEYGNARITAYNTSEKNATTTKPTVTPGNTPGIKCPKTPNNKNYFYTVNNRPYIPYYKIGDGYRRGLLLYFTPNTTLELPGITIQGSEGPWELFVRRFEAIFNFSKAKAGETILRFFSYFDINFDGPELDELITAAFITYLLILPNIKSENKGEQA